MPKLHLISRHGRSSHSVTNALFAWKNGNSAAQYVLELRLAGLFARLVGLVRRRRAARFNPRIDSHGVVNDAFYRLLIGIREDRFPDLQDRTNVGKLMYDFVGKILNEAVRDNSRECRDPAREVHDEDVIHGLPAREDVIRALPARNVAESLVLPANGKSTQCSLVIQECLETLEKRVRSVHARAMDILELLIELPNGPDRSREIARRLGMGRRNVQRIMKMMNEAWEMGQDA
jgi:hypothetical protein